METIPKSNIQTLVVTSDNSVSDLNNSALVQLMTKEWGLTNYNKSGDAQLEHVINKNNRPPDLIISEYSGKALSYNLWSQITEAWGGMPFLVHINGEGTQAPKWSNPANYHISFQPSSKQNMQFHATLLSPFISSLLMGHEKGSHDSVHNDEVLKAASKLRQHFIATAKDRFCNFVYSNHAQSQKRTNLDGLAKRQELCQLISDYKNVDCPGSSMHNTDNLKELEDNHGEWCADNIEDQQFPVEKRFLAKMRYLSRYKFTIAGENITSPYYISEKIIHPLIVGSIPIYIGCKEVAEMINPKAFINCNDYSSFAEVVELVRQIDNDPKLYQEFISQPAFLHDSLAHNYSKEKLQQSLAKIYLQLGKHIQKSAGAIDAYKDYSWARRKYTQLKNNKTSAVMWLWLWRLLLSLKKLVRN